MSSRPRSLPDASMGRELRMHSDSRATPPARERLLSLADRRAIVVAREAYRAGIHSQELTRLVARGSLERVGRGIYRVPDKPVSEHHALAVVACASPVSVICLMSALRFHGIGGPDPQEVWVAIPRRKRPPRVERPRLRIVTFTGTKFSAGIETHDVDGQPVRVYGLAKTIADLLRARRVVGTEVAESALREAWRDGRVTLAELERYAGICRVQGAMRRCLAGLGG